MTASYVRLIDEHHFVSISKNELLNLWDQRTGKVSKTISIAEGAKEFHLCDDSLFSLQSNTVTRFDLRAETSTDVLRSDTEITCFSPYGKWICCARPHEQAFSLDKTLKIPFALDIYNFEGKKLHSLESLITVDYLEFHHNRFVIGSRNSPQVDIIEIG